MARANWSAQHPQFDTPHVSKYIVDVVAAVLFMLSDDIFEKKLTDQITLGNGGDDLLMHLAHA